MTKEQKTAVLLATLAGFPPFMWGQPGRGKSSFVRAGFEKLGWLVKVFRLTNTLPHYLAGTQLPDPETGVARTYAPDWVDELNKANGKAVVLLDDFTAGTHMQQLAGLGMLDERMFGNTKLNARVIVASNHDTKSTIRHAIDAANANRCVHVDITGDAATFREDAMARFPAPQMPMLRKNWRELIAQKVDFYTKFLDSGDGAAVLNCQPERMTPETMAWPSERSWMMCAELDAAVAGLVPSSVEGVDIAGVKQLLLAGSVGKAAYEKFCESFRNSVDVNPSQALRDGNKFKIPEAPDKANAALIAIISFLSGGINDDQWNKAWLVAEAVHKTQFKDLLVPYCTELMSLGRSRYALPKFHEQHIKPLLAAVEPDEELV